MTTQDVKNLSADPDGLLTYEYIANNIETCEPDINWLADNVIRVDLKGQFTASVARYLHAIDREKYAHQIATLVDATIGKDREHKYLPDLLISIYGSDYNDRYQELYASDNNFRRIYKRLFPAASSF